MKLRLRVLMGQEINQAWTILSKPYFCYLALLLRSIFTNAEFTNALESLEKEECGCVTKVQAGRLNNQTIVFVKTKHLPDKVYFIYKDEYNKKYCLPIHSAVSESTKSQLQAKGLLPSE